MAKKRETQAQILERVRGEQDMSTTDFSAAVGVSRQWYYKILEGSDLDLKTLCILAVDQAENWRGALAVELIRLTDPRFVPCVCQTAIGDCGPCPKHRKE